MFVIAAGDLDQIDTGFFQQPNHGDTVVERETALLEVRGVQLHPDREGGSDRCAHGGDDFKQQPGAVFQRSAPFILALIDQRVEEFRQQIAMGRVDLNAGKAGLFGDKGGMGETTDNLVDFLDRQGAGLGEKPAGQGHFARR